MRRSPALSINYGKRRVTYGGRALRLNYRFFNLYCYLAVLRKKNPGQSGGYAECEQIRHLPGWTRNTRLSVGKQISRHVQATGGAGRSAVESETRVGGPFRLRPSRVLLDVPVAVLFKHLSLTGGGTRLPDADLVNYLKIFTDHYRKGVSLFNDGKFSQALQKFRLALKVTDRPSQWLAAAFYIRRIHERRGEFEEAAEMRSRSAERIKMSGKYWAWATGKDLNVAAWAEHQLAHFAEAEKLYTEALSVIHGSGFWDILGDIHNGLAEIARERGEYPASLSHYLEALDAWLLVDYFYGVQAIYFNIAALRQDMGNQLLRKGKEIEAMDQYRGALKWADACISLAAGLAEGFDTAETQILQSEVNRRLRKFDEAVKYAAGALAHAERTGNQRSFALSVGAFATALMDQGKKEEAAALVRQHYPSVKPSVRRLLGKTVLALVKDAPQETSKTSD